jgi:hypothetical protein
MSRVSSGSIVSDYGLDDRAIGVRSPAGAKDLSSNLCVQTGSEAHPASCTMGTGDPFPGGKSAARAWRRPLTPIYCRGREWVGAIPPLPQASPWRVAGLICLYISIWYFGLRKAAFICLISDLHNRVFVVPTWDNQFPMKLCYFSFAMFTILLHVEKH